MDAGLEVFIFEQVIYCWVFVFVCDEVGLATNLCKRGGVFRKIRINEGLKRDIGRTILCPF